MLKTLIKKQMLEINRSFFYDSKKGKNRTRKGAIAFIALYALLMVGILGGTFGVLAFSLGSVLVPIGLDWIYFDMMSAIAIILGIFGSVFSTYSALYLSKDNEFLLSMPVPVSYILISRLVGVYLMGLMFSAVVFVPTMVIYYIFAQKTFLSVFGPILMMLLISVFVTTLSVALGWGVAKLSSRLKNKSFATTAIALLFLALYYFVYFKATEMITDFLMAVTSMDIQVHGAMKILWAMGACAAGKPIPMLLATLVVAALFILAYSILSKSFIKIATTTTGTAKVQYKEGKAKRNSVGKTLFIKEMARFTSSSNYMLNCALGTIMMPLITIVLLVKGQAIAENLLPVISGMKATGILIAGALVVMLSMNDMTAATVSLEGKNIWILHTLPLEPFQVLKGKLTPYLVLTTPFALILSAVLAITFKATAIETLLALVFVLAYVVYNGEFGLVMNLLKPNLEWTNEVAPVKQGLPITVTMFGGWVFGVAVIGSGLLLGKYLDPIVILAVWSILTIILAVLLFSWLKTKGSKIFSEL